MRRRRQAPPPFQELPAATRPPARPATRSSRGRTAARSSGRRRPRRPGTRPPCARTARGSSSSGERRGSRACSGFRGRGARGQSQSRSTSRGSWTTYTNQPRRTWLPPQWAAVESGQGSSTPSMSARASPYAPATRARPASSSSSRSSWARPRAQAISRQAVVEAQAIVVEPVHVGGAALVSLGVDPLLERRVRGRDHPALPGRDLLVRVEAEYRRMPATADRHAVGIDRAERLARVLDDRQPEPLERTEVGWVTEDVHRQQRGVRSVIAAAAASGSRLNVTGSMSANTGRARSYTITLALATNENGLVTTSSPSLTPTARSARCSPAVPLETALAWAAPTRRANSLLELGQQRAERQAPGAEHLEHALDLELAHHRARERDGVVADGHALPGEVSHEPVARRPRRATAGWAGSISASRTRASRPAPPTTPR